MDITMCPGGRCPRKEYCLRWRATLSPLQSTFVTPPLAADDSCTYHVPTEGWSASLRSIREAAAWWALAADADTKQKEQDA